MKHEWTLDEWLKVSGRPRSHHQPGCRGRCSGVFRCRARGKHHCGRIVGWCCGGDDDNRCADCWLAHRDSLRSTKKLQREVLHYISAEFNAPKDPEIFGAFAHHHDARIEHALRELLRSRQILRHRSGEYSALK